MLNIPCNCIHSQSLKCKVEPVTFKLSTNGFMGAAMGNDWIKGWEAKLLAIIKKVEWLHNYAEVPM